AARVPRAPPRAGRPLFRALYDRCRVRAAAKTARRRRSIMEYVLRVAAARRAHARPQGFSRCARHARDHDRRVVRGAAPLRAWSALRLSSRRLAEHRTNRRHDRDAAAACRDDRSRCRSRLRCLCRDHRRAPTMKNPVLSVVVPVYNEEAGLKAFFARLYPALDALAIPYEVIFINDGSHDRSAGLLKDQFIARPDVT